MKCSKPGQFYGKTNETVFLKGVILNDADYIHDRVDWHFHENSYFTFILEGGTIDGNKKQVYECSSGGLLFHNWQDAHYNIASGKSTRGFHVEIFPEWFSSFDIPVDAVEGSISIADPQVKMLMYTIFKETKLNRATKQLAIDALLIEIFGLLSHTAGKTTGKKPGWVGKVRDALHDPSENWQLADLAKLADVHPVHLSRTFSKYFNATLGDYIRTVKVQQALSLLPDKEISLTDIAIQCGFADQSHFIRSFKSYQQLTPLRYRKLLLKK